MRSQKKIILFSGLFLLPFFSFGWGVIGHRVVGQIADSYLTPKARVEIQNILGNESVAMVSSWADFIKSDSDYQYIYNWHFIDLDSGLTRPQLRNYLQKDTVADLFTKTNFLIRELKNKHLAMDKKRMYLKLLIHFVGDIHQPFHVGRHADLGGNKIKLTWFSTSTNLHAIWDDQLINFQQLSYTEYSTAINHATAKQRLAWQKQPISEWIIESHEISERLYAQVTPDQKLSYRYNYDNVQILNERLLKAGVRLAGVLNELFGR